MEILLRSSWVCPHVSVSDTTVVQGLVTFPVNDLQGQVVTLQAPGPLVSTVVVVSVVDMVRIGALIDGVDISNVEKAFFCCLYVGL